MSAKSRDYDNPHNDISGNELVAGDVVVYSSGESAELRLAVVYKFTPKMITLIPLTGYSRGWGKKVKIGAETFCTRTSYGSQIAKISNPVADEFAGLPLELKIKALAAVGMATP